MVRSGWKFARSATPSFTGKQKLVDSAGRVERFKQKYGEVKREEETGQLSHSHGEHRRESSRRSRKRFEEVTAELGKPEVIADPGRIQSLAKVRSELEPIVAQYRELRTTKSQLEETRTMLAEADEAELKALAQEEIERLESEEERLTQALRLSLLPKDPNDERNVLLEIRAGTGGEEAALFAQEVFRMYSQYAEAQGWKVQVMSVQRHRYRRHQGGRGSDRRARVPTAG